MLNEKNLGKKKKEYILFDTIYIKPQNVNQSKFTEFRSVKAWLWRARASGRNYKEAGDNF